MCMIQRSIQVFPESYATGTRIFRLWMQGYQWYHGSISERSSTSCEEYTQESSNIPHPINSGTSLCILQGYVPFLPCNDNNGAEGESEDIFHCNVLQPCKGKISWPDSVSYWNLWENGCKNMVKHTLLHPIFLIKDWFYRNQVRYKVKVKVLGKPQLYIVSR